MLLTSFNELTGSTQISEVAMVQNQSQGAGPLLRGTASTCHVGFSHASCLSARLKENSDRNVRIPHFWR